MKTKFILFLLAISGILGLQDNLFAQDKKCILLEGLYSSVNGDFDGETTLVGGDEGILIPKLKSNYGFGISFGKIERGRYIGFKYSRFQYDATFDEVELGKAMRNIFGIEFKRFFPKEKKVMQFFISGTAEFGTLRIENGFITSSSDLTDANLFWVGLPIGVGFSINPIKEVSINFCAAYRLAMVTTAKEYKASYEPMKLEDKLAMGGINCGIGLAFNF
jgi:hypothetical protein